MNPILGRVISFQTESYRWEIVSDDGERFWTNSWGFREQDRTNIKIGARVCIKYVVENCSAFYRFSLVQE